MSKRPLPAPRALSGRPDSDICIPPAALGRWRAGVRPLAQTGNNVITILDVIGEDFLGDGGVTAKRISGALRAIGPQDVEVLINSPGGDLFEGLAIYNLFRLHPGQVTVRILSLAASAASVIAMAGDRIEIPRSGFLMIHNVMAVVAGNRHDMREVADLLEPFDGSMADIYAARTGVDKGRIATMMDRESWINGEGAVEQGFADDFLAPDQVTEDMTMSAALAPDIAARRVDVMLARQNLPRAERRKLIHEMRGTPSAAANGTPCAAESATPGAGGHPMRPYADALAQWSQIELPKFEV